MGGPQGRSGRARKIRPCPPLGFGPRPVQPVASRYFGPRWVADFGKIRAPRAVLFTVMCELSIWMLVAVTSLVRGLVFKFSYGSSVLFTVMCELSIWMIVAVNSLVRGLVFKFSYGSSVLFTVMCELSIWMLVAVNSLVRGLVFKFSYGSSVWNERWEAFLGLLW